MTSLWKTTPKGKVLGHKKAMWGGSIQSNILMGTLHPTSQGIIMG